MKPLYLLGIPEMDAQHARLFELAGLAQREITDEFEMNKVILDLIAYATFHLDSEEKFLRAQGLYEFLNDHLPKHEAFRDRAIEFYDDFRSSSSLDEKFAVLRRVARFCEAWLVNHIHIEDRGYAIALQRRRLRHG